MPVRFIDLKYFQINAKEEAREFQITSIYFLGFFGIFVLGEFIPVSLYVSTK